MDINAYAILVFCRDCHVAELVDVSDVPLGGKTVASELRANKIEAEHRAFGHEKLSNIGGFVGQERNRILITYSLSNKGLTLGKLARR